MCYWWYVIFAVGGLGVIGLIGSATCKILEKGFDRKRETIRTSIPRYDYYEKQYEGKREQMSRLGYKSDACHNLFYVFLAIGIIALATSLIILLVVGALGLKYKVEFARYNEKYNYVMQVVDTMSDNQFANLGITNTILDYNSWLEKAKASKSTYGNWSLYKNIDLESMHYLGVGQ